MVPMVFTSFFYSSRLLNRLVEDQIQKIEVVKPQIVQRTPLAVCLRLI